MEIRKTSHARYDLWYHIAWSTKYRKKIFKDKWMVEWTKKLFRKIAMQYDIDMKGVERAMSFGSPGWSMLITDIDDAKMSAINLLQ